jgi:hypothetical protein
MPQPSSSLARDPSNAIDDSQLIQYYPSTIPDLLAGQEHRNMMTPFPSIEQIHKENATPLFQLKGNSGVDRHTLPHSMIDAIPSSSHGTVSAYGTASLLLLPVH